MDRIGQQLGNYRLVKLLGQGGFADVYLGEHLHLDTRAAIKILQTRLVGSNLSQFRQEARTVARLIHPNIVRVLDFGIEEDVPFLIMDYAQHGAISQRHPPGSRVLPATIVPYLKQVAAGLQYAHDQKFIHRDIKPENILLDASNKILLSDFGLVLMTSSSSQNILEFAGTVSYMAPEQLQGKPRPASDQYALGIVIYQWLCGELPFTGSFAEIASQHVLTPPSSLCDRVPGLPAELEKVVFTALAKDPQERFVSVTAFAEAFETVSSTIDPSTMFASPDHQPGPRITDLSTIIGIESPSPSAETTEEDSSTMPAEEASPAISSNPRITPDISTPTETTIDNAEAKPGQSGNKAGEEVKQSNEYTTAPEFAAEQIQTKAEQAEPGEIEKASDEDAATLFDEQATIPVEELASLEDAKTIAGNEDKNDDEYRTIPFADQTDQDTASLPAMKRAPGAESETPPAETESLVPENTLEKQSDQQAEMPEVDIAHQMTDLIHDPNYTIDPTEGPTVSITDLPLPVNAAQASVSSDVSELSTANINQFDNGKGLDNLPQNNRPGIPLQSQDNYPSQPPTEPDTAHAGSDWPQASFSSMPTKSVLHAPPRPSAQGSQAYDSKKNVPPVQPPLHTLRPYYVPGAPLFPSPYGAKPVRRQRSHRAIIVILLFLIILTVSVASAFYFVPNDVKAVVRQIRGIFPQAQVSTPTPNQGLAPKVTITLTSDSTQFQDNFGITAVTGTPDSTKDQVGARLLTATSSNKSKTTTITTPTTIPGKQGDGILQLTNLTNNSIRLAAGTAFTSNGGIEIIIDPATTVPPLQTITVNAHANNTGLAGNIPALDLNTCLNLGTPPPTLATADPTPGTVTPTSNQVPSHSDQHFQGGFAKANHPDGGCATSGTIKNPVAFSGGQNDTSTKVVQQRDIDSATLALNDSLLPGVQKQLQAQTQPGERIDGDPQCQQKFTPDQVIGDQADSVTIKGTLTCTVETYDLSAAEALARQDLQNKISSNGSNSGYQLRGQIMSALVNDSPPDANNAIRLNISAQGIWNYQMSDSQKQIIIQSILGKSRNDAQNILNTQSGVSKATISGGTGPLPTDPNQINLVINQGQ